MTFFVGTSPRLLRGKCTAAIAFFSFALAIPSCTPAVHAPEKGSRPPTGPATWQNLSWEDRHEVMTFAVLPNIARTWQAFEKTRYPDTTCARCHGADAEAASYKLPNPAIAPLDPERMPSAASTDPREARMAKFMVEEIVPQMTELLDAEPYDATTGHGFSCFACHTKGKR